MNDVKRPDSLEKSWRGKIRLQNRSQIRGVQRSVLGTFETCRPTLSMPAYRGGSEVNGAGQNGAFDPTGRCAPQGRNCGILRQTR